MIWNDRKFLWLFFSSVFVVTLELLSLIGITLPDTIALPFYIFLILVIGYHTLFEGFKALFTLNFKSINLLMLIAVCGALYLGKYEEAAVVIVLYTLAEKLEDLGILKSKSALKILVDQMPKELTVKGEEKPVSLSSIKLGDIVVIKPGGMIPIDGEVVEGLSSVDESTITGEPIPRDKSPGDAIYSGTLNNQGYLEVKVTALPQDSTLSKIQQLTYEATKSKAKTQKFIESFARVYTPTIMLMAIGLTAIPVLFFGESFDLWFFESLTLLVIACPCALVISTPISIYSAVGKASSLGVLIKGGRYLETIGHVKAMAFDKTRTLTLGKPHVTDVIAFGKSSEDEVLSCAAGIEKYSEHPLSESIVTAAKARHLDLHESTDFQSFMGKGVRGTCTVCESGHRCVGKLKFILEEHSVPEEIIEKIESLQREGKTVIVISSEHEITGLIALSDTIRDESPELIEKLHSMGVKSAMLTGDHEIVAKTVGDALGIDEVHAELLPEDKVNSVKEMIQRYRVVGMVGDGVNDSPALAVSSVGISMSSLGSDAAIESASIVLLNDRLNLIPQIVKLGRRTNRIIRFNTFWAVMVKLVFVGLALTGHGNLALAIFADVGVTVLVILNGLRLLK
ncbi:MAG: putative cadmium-transporting ATPase [Chlamydiae bacterium]|nr:putative cadmium-transporting ATPase [Chlamydiota bacterium]